MQGGATGSRGAKWVRPKLGDSTSAPVQPRVVAADREKADRQDAETRTADEHALHLYEMEPAKHPLTQAQRFRLQIREGVRVHAADAKAQQSRDAGAHSAAAEREQHSEHNSDSARELVTSGERCES